MLIAFVVVSTTFAFAALSVGLENAETAEDTIRSGLEKARSTLELKGSVIAKAATTGSAGTLEELTFFISLAANVDFIDLTQGNTIIKYIDGDQTILFDTVAEFTVGGIGNADTDNLLEPREIYEVKMTNMNTTLTTPLRTGDSFTIEVVPPAGAVLRFKRSLPVFLDLFMDLG